MYTCGICYSIFDVPAKEGHFSDRDGLEEILKCPCCGSEAISEAVICEECGKRLSEDDEDKYHGFYFDNSYGEHIEGCVCNDCLSEMLPGKIIKKKEKQQGGNR